jgi:hypothetical protein
MRFVIVPGIGNSDGGHWQSIWQATWGVDAAQDRTKLLIPGPHALPGGSRYEVKWDGCLY